MVLVATGDDPPSCDVVQAAIVVARDANGRLIGMAGSTMPVPLGTTATPTAPS